MKEFIVRHPFITFLIVDTVCVTIQNCVASIVETPKHHSISHQVVNGTVEAIHEAFPPKEG